jgi:hypothetical protein
VLAVALMVSAIVLMPLLGWAKLRLGRRLDSGATAGEGIQNIMCAVQAATALVAVAGAGIGLSFLDPLAALVIAGIALKEGRDGWRGEDSSCTPLPGRHNGRAVGGRVSRRLLHLKAPPECAPRHRARPRHRAHRPLARRVCRRAPS